VQELCANPAWSGYAQEGEEHPWAQFMASYNWVMTCLMTPSASIHPPESSWASVVWVYRNDRVGEPKRVTAFEVWLFDKNDIQT